MPRLFFSARCSVFVRFCLFVGLFAALSACAYADSQEPETIYLGLIVPESSELSSLATAMQNGANLALDQVNEQGGLLVGDNWYRLVLVVEDDRNIPDQAVEAARRLILQHDARAIVGPSTSRTAMATAALAETLRVPMISPTATHPDLTAGRDFVFRVSFSDDFQGQVMAEFALNRLRLSRAAVLYDLTNSYNRGIAEIFQASFTAQGGDVVAFESYLVGEDNFRPQLSRIQAADPDFIFLPNFTNDVLRQAQQAREMGITAVFLGSDSWEWQRLTDDPALDGAYFSNHYNPEQSNADSQDFVSAYQNRYNALPTGGAALTYDAFQLIFQAMQNERATDAEAVQRGLAAIVEFPGVTGSIRYVDGRRDPIRSVVILQLLDQQVHFFELIDP
jgi:branched-chain amino acid transport system substrate-binding protein